VWVKAITAFGAIMATALWYRRGHHPFPRFGAANWVTTLRALIVAFLVGSIGKPPTPRAATAAIVLALGATMLDGVDGWLARRSALTSAFGARFDMEVDSLLILVLAVLVWQHHKAGAWVLAAGLLRYAFVAAGWVWSWMRAPLPGTPRGKAVCVVEIVTLLVALTPAVPAPASGLVAAAGLTMLVYSFAVDTASLWRRAL
jgi:phosphatidylglycerophosphate synthase